MTKVICGQKKIDQVIKELCVTSEGWKTKEEILRRMYKGESFCVPDGTIINQVPKSGIGEYLRTDANETLSDNLGNLPSTCKC